jgi:hypothetical protein
LAAVGAVATVVVMDVPAFARADVAGWLRQWWRFTGEESLATKLLRRPVAACTGLDTHGMVGVGDVVDMHRATGQLHGRLNALAMPPRCQTELHGPAPPLSSAPTLANNFQRPRHPASRFAFLAAHAARRSDCDEVEQLYEDRSVRKTARPDSMSCFVRQLNVRPAAAEALRAKLKQ